MGAEDKALIRELRSAFAQQASPANAEAMRRYMKSSLRFYGLKAGPTRKTCRQVFAQHPLGDFEAWRDTSPKSVGTDVRHRSYHARLRPVRPTLPQLRLAIMWMATEEAWRFSSKAAAGTKSARSKTS